MIEGRDSKVSQLYPISYKWDGRIRSPRELFRVLHDFLDEYGYQHEYDELKEKPGAIEGTATFWDDLVGKKDYRKRNKVLFFTGLGLLLIGLITLIVGVATFPGRHDEAWPIGVDASLLITGAILTAISSSTLRKCIKLHIEGETYRARAEQRGAPLSEVLDVASNCRVVFTAEVGKPKKDSIDVSKLTTRKEEWGTLQKEFESLKADFEKLRPRIELPEAVRSDKAP